MAASVRKNGIVSVHDPLKVACQLIQKTYNCTALGRVQPLDRPFVWAMLTFLLGMSGLQLQGSPMGTAVLVLAGRLGAGAMPGQGATRLG